jgi:molybdenum cofactor biosynthesis protein B
MPKIDEKRAFIPVSIAVLTVSDTRGPADDRSGDALAEMIAEAGHQLAARAIVKDDVLAIRNKVEAWIAEPAIDVIITTGGTGFTGHDVTPEAVKPLFEKEVDGFSIVFHMISFGKVATSTIQSRACAGRRRRSRHVYLLPAGIARCLQGRVERHPEMAAG